MIINAYGVIMFMPLIPAFIWKFLDNKELVQSIKDEYYLWLGYSLTFFALFVVLSMFSLTSITSVLLVPAYLIFYVIIQLLLHFVFKEGYDLGEKMKDIKLLGK